MSRNIVSESQPNKTQRKKRNADEKLCRAMVNSIMDYAIIITDPNGIIISLNKGAELILGYRDEEVSGKSIEIFYPQETLVADSPAMNLQEALVNNNYQVKGWRIKKDGSRFLANIHYTALYDEKRKLLGYTKIIYEIAEHSEVQLSGKIKHNPVESNISFRKLIENSYSGISLLDKDFKVIYRSPSAENVGGWTADEIKKGGTGKFIHPADRDKVQEIFKTALQSPTVPISCTFRSKHIDGSYIWMDCVFTNFLDEPNVNAVVCNFINVTDRKEAELMLKQTVQELSAFKYALDESAIVAITDQKGIIKHVNEKFCKISKYSREELIGQDHQIINSGFHSKSFIKSLWTTIAKGKIWKGEIRNKAKDGTIYWVDTTIVPFLNPKGKPYQYIAIRSDITERKLAEEEIKRKSSQIENLLENINDGFIALDENLNYTYVNKKIGELLGIDQSELIGKYIWGVFPDSIGTKTYDAIQKTFKEHVPVINEDYYAPLNLWQENRVYPSGKGISMFIRDITGKKEEEHHLKLLESVITNTTDAIMITEAEPYEEPGPRILYINQAFLDLTGYTEAEVLGRSPRFLQGPKSDRQELSRLKDSMMEWKSCEISTINYKKNGEEFWMNFSISPVSDEHGDYTHWIAVERDITQRKNYETQKNLLAEIRTFFNEQVELNEILTKILIRLADYGNFIMAEAWMVSPDEKKINLISKYSSSERMEAFYNESAEVKSFVKGEGIPGVVWETGRLNFSPDITKNENFLRTSAAQIAGVKSTYGIPVCYGNQIIGVLLLGLPTLEKQENLYSTLFEDFNNHFGAEIKRKQLELELKHIFSFAPDIICITGVDTYFKKVNPAMIDILEYTELELLNRPFINFVHPDDQERTMTQFYKVLNGEAAIYFECRFISRSGKVKWLAWTTTTPSEDGLIFCVAKDISEKRELENLLKKANTLARIGSWEIDLLKGTVFWSDITREIHQVDDDFAPTLESGLSFYKDGESRKFITQKIKDAIEKGMSWDVELEIITARGNVKWIRVIGEVEIADKKCVRIYGSFQDIDARKRAEMTVTEILEDRNTILESIGDAFFAVDKNWTVTYWNNMAEKVLGKQKQEMLNSNLWDIFSDAIDSESYKKYQEVVSTQTAMHFEDFYPPLQKWYEISAYPSGTGLAVYFKDITERKDADIRLKELNESLQIQTKQLATSNAELEQFAYVASHDLQEPLRMVSSFLTQIERKYENVLDEKGRRYINFAVDGAMRMRQIILDLLEFSKVGTLEDSAEDIDLNELINEILALYRKQIEESRAKVIFKKLPVLNFYKTPLRQVLINLISNSLKYRKEDTPLRIQISCTETDAQWQISVADNGIGIDPAYFDKIFIIFQRLHNRDAYSGVGMGLAISKKIIENLGGKIWVESSENNGSTFYFTIIKHPEYEKD
ncbi:MAG TPA: PAS domain S-box protein [Mucilaginibacter sp.]|nr:PAS domain S-box protein [Mucilaginibacter sp.]